MNSDPIIIYFTLTKACNLSCIHCVRSHTPNNTYLEDIQTMDYDSALCVVEKLSEFYPNATLALTGGEPTLHSNFFEIAKKSVSLFKNVVLTTNGVFKDQVRDKLVKLTDFNNFFIQVSLDGGREAHDRIRGVGNFDKTFGRIVELSNCCRQNSVSISTTVSRYNQDSMFDLANKIKDLPISKWRIAPEQIFNAEELSRQISPTEWNVFVDEILMKCYFKVSIKKIFDFQLMDKSLESPQEGRIIRSNCGFGRYKLYIYPDFSVLPCTCMPHITIGNILVDDVAEINQRLSNCEPKITNDSPCITCKYLPICKGGCVGYSFHYNGKIGYGDMRCPKVQRSRII